MSEAETSDVVADTLGRPLRDLRISVTDRCNLRCTYCMPAETYHEAYEFLSRECLLSFEEITRVAEAAVALGARKLRLTGGEPLLRKHLPVLVRMLAAVPGVEDLALTTNGMLLPKFAHALKQAGLQRVTVSLDSLDDEVFARMSGRGGNVGEVLAGIAAAQKAGLGPVKINVVVQKGVNDHTLLDMVEHFRESGHLLRFIEFMDVGTLNAWKLKEVLPSRELLQRIHARYPLRQVAENYPGEVARRYQFEDGKGEVGFISSVTQPFCGDCTRLRLSSDGKLYTCLFAHLGEDVRGLLREGAGVEELKDFLRGLWVRRGDRYSELRAGRTPVQGPKVEMYHIGG